MFRIPISRKVVAQTIAGLVVTLVAKAGVDLPAAWEDWIVVGAGLTAGVAVPEAVKFLDYAAERAGLKLLDFTERD